MTRSTRWQPASPTTKGTSCPRRISRRIRWIEHLTEAGKAIKLAGGGYPNRYTARAGDVLPLIEGGGIQPPKDGVWIFGFDEGEEYAQPPGWMGPVLNISREH